MFSVVDSHVLGLAADTANGPDGVRWCGV